MLSTLRSTAKNSLIYGIGNLSTKLIGLILLPLYTKVLPVGEFGMLAMLETTSQILITVFGLSLYSAFFRWYYEEEYIESRKSMFFTIFLFLGLVSGVMVFCLIMGSKGLSSFLLDTSKNYKLIRLMVITSGMEILAVLPLTLMRIQERPGLFISANITKFTVNLTLTIIFIAGLKHRIEGIYEAQIIGNVIFFLFLSRYIYKHIELKFHLKALREMLSFSLPLVLASIAGIFLSLTDRYSIKFIEGLEKLGTYQFGFKIANAIKIIVLNSVNYALTPVIYRVINEKGSKRFYSKIMTYMGFGVMIIVLMVASYGKEISMIFADKKEYWSAYTLIPVLALGLFFSSLKDTAFTGINITKKTRVSAIIIISVSIINIILNIGFILLLQSMGAAIATCISQFIFLVLVWKYSQKYFYIPYELLKLVKIFLTGSLLIVLAMFSNYLPLFIAVAVKLLLIISFPFILYLWNFFESVEIEHLRGFLEKWKNPAKWLANNRS